MREKLASRLGFILLSAGCAIGLGNVWRFPYVAGQSGGGWFVFIYLVCLALLGLPVLVMEFAVGRAAQRSLALAHAQLRPDRPVWRLHGVAGFFGNLLLMMFYTTVTGWMLIYFWKSAAGGFDALDAQAVGGVFASVLGDWQVQALAMLLVCTVAAVISAIGLRRGVERITKWMMLSLLVLIVVLAANSMLLPNAGSGVRFLLVPDTARFTATGPVKVIVNAMCQSFFTLSLGIGAMTIFGSYIGKSRTLLGEALSVVTLDTLVAISAGLIILPACFAYGIEAGQGPGLVFVTLPSVFNHMSGGRLWGSLFFLFMCFAALTTVLAVFENIVACIVDYTEWSRRRVCLIMLVVMPLLSLPCVLGFNLWAGFCPLGAGSSVLDLEDFIVSNLLLPFGALAFAIFCCHRYGWGWEKFLAEANAGAGPRIPAALRGYCAYILPLLIFGIFIIGLLDKFKVIKL